jgi:hypothetical protein
VFLFGDTCSIARLPANKRTQLCELFEAAMRLAFVSPPLFVMLVELSVL